jgi:hypothetical protein
MGRYRGFPKTDNHPGWAMDGCACYDSNGNCICADCYHYGLEHVNCQTAFMYLDSNLKPVKWDGTQWVLDL